MGKTIASNDFPSHAINDIAAAASQLESDGRKILLLFPDEASATKFNASDYGELPSNAIIGSDIDSKIRNAIISGLELPDSTPLPLFVVADTFNRIIFNRNGYSINLGEQLHDVLSRVKDDVIPRIHLLGLRSHLLKNRKCAP